MINSKTAFKNAKKYWKDKVFLGNEKVDAENIAKKIVLEIEKLSLKGQINFQIEINSTDIMTERYLGYITLLIREKGFMVRVNKYRENYLFTASS